MNESKEVLLTESSKYAVFDRGHNLSDTHFKVTFNDDNCFTLLCTHGGWEVDVDKFGRAIGDINFEEGKQMINKIMSN